MEVTTKNKQSVIWITWLTNWQKGKNRKNFKCLRINKGSAHELSDCRRPLMAILKNPETAAPRLKKFVAH
jgi:hypothetical protein